MARGHSAAKGPQRDTRKPGPAHKSARAKARTREIRREQKVASRSRTCG